MLKCIVIYFSEEMGYNVIMRLELAKEVLKKEISGVSYFDALKDSFERASSNHAVAVSDILDARVGSATKEQKDILERLMNFLSTKAAEIASFSFDFPWSSKYWPLSELHLKIIRNGCLDEDGNDLEVFISPKIVKVRHYKETKAFSIQFSSEILIEAKKYFN